jgi:hypothetical protein
MMQKKSGVPLQRGPSLFFHAAIMTMPMEEFTAGHVCRGQKFRCFSDGEFMSLSACYNEA